jgi:hypothetical protein
MECGISCNKCMNVKRCVSAFCPHVTQKLPVNGVSQFWQTEASV